MKKKYSFSLAILFAFCSFATQAQITLAQWNFNGTAADAVAGGVDTPTVSVGAGTAVLQNGVIATFASGTSSGGSSDPETTSPPNFGWNTTNYADLGTENKIKGVRFNVSTVGYTGITFKFDQRLSNTANNTYVVQYSTNGSVASPVWVDAQTFTFTPEATGTGDTWFNQRTVDLTAVSALNNNANCAFRIVSAFDPVTGNYLAARSTSTYSPAGTVRFDMVTITAVAPLSINENEFTTFTMFPNPVTTGLVTFSKAISFELFDVTGKSIIKEKEVTTLNTSSLAKGIYFIKTIEGVTKKLVVN